MIVHPLVRIFGFRWRNISEICKIADRSFAFLTVAGNSLAFPCHPAQDSDEKVAENKTFKNLEPNQLSAAKRPAEIVRTYIESEFFHAQTEPNMRLPTIKEFSEHLNVSASTVRSVFKTLSDEGWLETVPGRGTFLVKQAAPAKPSKHHCIGINSVEMPAEGWWGAIFLGVTGAAFKSHMMVTALGAVRTTREGNPNVSSALDRVDGVIAFPDSGYGHEIDTICAERKLPVVHVNPSSFHATANFVSTDYFGFAYRLAEAWRETGRRRIVLVMGESLANSVSAAQTYSAFSLAFASCREASLTLLEGANSGKAFGTISAEMGQFLMEDHPRQHGPESVDAVYGFGDLLAQGAIKALEATGRKIPRDVSVIGGTGLDVVALNSGRLVSMKQPMKKIGESATKLLIWRIQNQGYHTPGVYLMPELGEGTSLRAEERQAFQRILKQDNALT